MDDPLLVRVLDCVTNLDQEFKPLLQSEPILVAILGDPDAGHQFHHEIGAPGFRGAGVEHAGNIRMIHHGQRLPLGLEPGDHRFGVHPQFDDL